MSNAIEVVEMLIANSDVIAKSWSSNSLVYTHNMEQAAALREVLAGYRENLSHKPLTWTREKPMLIGEFYFVRNAEKTGNVLCLKHRRSENGFVTFFHPEDQCKSWSFGVDDHEFAGPVKQPAEVR